MTNIKPKVIMGIDPGFATVGFGFITCEKNPQIISCGCIETTPDTEFKERLNIIHRELKELIDKYQPEIVGVEEIFFANNAKTAINVSHARGVILLTLSQDNLPIYEFTPLQIKQAITGYGKADKKQVEEMVMISLKLKQRPKRDDAADALAIALTTMYSLNSPLK